MTRPASWELAPLLDVCTARMGPTILAKDLTEEGLPVYSAGGGDKPWGHTTLPVEQFSRGTIVLAARGSIGNPRLPDQPAFTSTQTTIALRGGAGLDCRYLKHFLGSIPWADVTSGAAIPMLTIGKLGELSIPIAPASEQRRIADKLDTVLARVDSVNDRLARVTPLLKRFRQAVLAAASAGRLTQPPLASDYLDQHHATEPTRRGWQQARLSSISDVIDPNPKHRNPQYQADGELFLSTTNFAAGGGWDLTAAKRVSMATVVEQQERCNFNRQSLVFSRKGTIGKVRMVPPVASFALLDSLVVINAKAGVDPRYLLLALQMPVVQDQVVRLTRGVALKQVSVGVVRSLEIPLPTEIEQTEIARRVELLFAYADRLEARIQAARLTAERLTPALLAKAFRGELVPQDPDDEPASELLKRLAAQREQGGATSARPRSRRPATSSS